ncbi:MAG: hypothetical protein AAB557_00985 [Patescibacteria group bacterium]
MLIKITPLSNKHSHLEGIFKVKNCYYLAQFHSAGIITEIKKSDDWLEQEMSWVTRSEIPFITALRHAQLESEHLVEGALTPVVRRFGPFYKTKKVDKFPTRDDCMQLVYKYCEYTNDGGYHFYKRDIDEDDVKKLVTKFDYKNNLFVRAGACLYKAYILLNTSSLFAEETYNNTFIAYEAIVEHLKFKNGFSGKDARNKVIDLIGEYLKKDNPGIDFTDYEEEMRDGIRNNIIHPFRAHSGERVAQPFLMADYIFEDLGFIDWLFKKVIEGKLK